MFSLGGGTSGFQKNFIGTFRTGVLPSKVTPGESNRTGVLGFSLSRLSVVWTIPAGFEYLRLIPIILMARRTSCTVMLRPGLAPRTAQHKSAMFPNLYCGVSMFATGSLL